MAYFTKSEARAAAANRRHTLAKSFNDILSEGNASISVHDEFDIFLSHSIQDAELVFGMKELLEKRGLSVYVDWDTDTELDRSSVSKETAALLRLRMQQSTSMLYLATNNASSSKWMPWELGYFDGRNNRGVAILPLMDNPEERFGGQEYLSLYPLVTKDEYTDGLKDVFVEERGQQWTTLNEFASGRAVWKNYRPKSS